MDHVTRVSSWYEAIETIGCDGSSTFGERNFVKSGRLREDEDNMQFIKLLYGVRSTYYKGKVA